MSACNKKPRRIAPKPVSVVPKPVSVVETDNNENHSNEEKWLNSLVAEIFDDKSTAAQQQQPLQIAEYQHDPCRAVEQGQQFQPRTVDESTASHGLFRTYAAKRPLDDISSTFNKLSKVDYNPKSSRVLQSLLPGVEYPITSARVATTRYGRRIVCDLADGSSVFLPARFAQMSDQQLAELNRTQHSIIYHGLETNMYNVTYHNVECIPSINKEVQ